MPGISNKDLPILVDALLHGVAVYDLARALGVCDVTVSNAIRDIPLLIERPGRRKGPGSKWKRSVERISLDERRQMEMRDLYRAGFTLAQVGEWYCLTRERVRQIIDLGHDARPTAKSTAWSDAGLIKDAYEKGVSKLLLADAWGVHHHLVSKIAAGVRQRVRSKRASTVAAERREAELTPRILALRAAGNGCSMIANVLEVEGVKANPMFVHRVLKAHGLNRMLKAGRRRK